MRTIILAGGEGKRLRPVTCTCPKPMVPLLNKPTLFYTLELLKRHGVDEALISVGYMAGAIKNAVGSGEAFGIRVRYRAPSLRLGTAGSVKNAIGGDVSETVLVMSGDGVTDLDITAAYEAHKRSGAAATLVLKSVSDPREYGIAVCDENSFIKGFLEKPAGGEIFSDLANTGVYFIEPEALREIPDDAEQDFSRDVFPRLLNNGKKLFGFRTEGYWSDIGSAYDLCRTQRDMLEGRCAFETAAIQSGGIFKEPGAVISDKAILVPPCYIASGAQVAAYAEVGAYSVIGRGARLEEGSSVKRSVLLHDSVLRRSAEVRGAVVCENAEIGADAAVFEGAVIGAGSRVLKGATVCRSVSIWPEKTVLAGENVRNDIVWGQGRRLHNDGSGFTGEADTQLTPEAAVGIGAAYASTLKLPAELAIGCDGSAVSVILKHALSAGAASRGAEVLASEPGSIGAFASLIRYTGAVGGIFVRCIEDRTVTVTLFDEHGTEADPQAVRAVERSLHCGDCKPSTMNELGLIRAVSGGKLLLRTEALRSINAAELSRSPRRLLLNASKDVCGDISYVLLRLGWRVECAYDGKMLMPVRGGDTLSLLLGGNEHLTAMITPDTVIDHCSLITLIAEDMQVKCAALPLETDPKLEKYLRERGIRCDSAPENAASRRRYAMRKGIYVPALLEPEMTILKVCELFSRGVLQTLPDNLPQCKRRTAYFGMPNDMTGRALRALMEEESQRVESIAEGVKLCHDDGWVTVSPCGDGNGMRVAAGSSDAEYSKELCDIYIDKLNSINERRRQNKES